MTFALALLLASLDGGRHGDAFALHGVGVPVWEQYRRYQGAGFPVVSLQADGGALQFSNVRQGCNEDGGGCVFAAPGVFISRVPGIASPSFSPVWFSNVEPTDRAFDVRFALLEAAADGGLQAFVRQAGADNGAEMDPYFPPGVDGLVLHVTIQADGTGRAGELVNATCTTDSSGLREELRANRLAESSTPMVSIPSGAQFTWGLVDAGSGNTGFSVFANKAELWRWTIPGSRFAQCGNADDGGYSDGVLALNRLVPVLYVGWGTFVTPLQSATLTMGFGGHGPQFGPVPTTTFVGQPINLPIRLVDGDGNVVLGPSTSIDVSIISPEPFSTTAVSPGLTLGGEITRFFTPTIPQIIRAVLQIDNPFVAVERVITVVPGDGGVTTRDAGPTPDAGVPDAGVPDAGVPDAGVPDAGVPDAGVPDAGVPDAGVPGVPDAGVPDGGKSDSRDLRVGCGCSESNASMLLALVLTLSLRRRR